ncbi:MAG: hypothetical protein IJD81_01040 [Oscillospiraceae bacterium]|nr:hypothetical protein [Oscillospiraceae bacterium]
MGYERADVICPFYCYDSSKEKRIVCEGVLPNTTITQRFSRKKQWEKFIDRYCIHHCNECELFRLILRVKYPDF